MVGIRSQARGVLVRFFDKPSLDNSCVSALALPKKIASSSRRLMRLLHRDPPPDCSVDDDLTHEPIRVSSRQPRG